MLDTASVRDGLPSLNGYRKITFDVRGRTSRRFSVHAIAIKNNERSRRAASMFKRENYAAFGFRDQRFLAETTTMKFSKLKFLAKDPEKQGSRDRAFAVISEWSSKVYFR